MPKEGAFATGQVVKADEKSTGNGAPLQRKASQIADDHWDAPGNRWDDTKEIQNGVAGVSLSPLPGSPMEGNTPRTGSPPPTARTAPGPPKGDVVFDHQPSEGEIREAKESLDQLR